MNTDLLSIADVRLLTPRRFQDARGLFSETWHQGRFTADGIIGPFVQDNHVVSNSRGVLRGLHCQIGPSAQGKLVRAVRGAIWDVAVDIRCNSATYGQHISAVLSAENWRQIWIPIGFLHGYCTLTDHTEVIYKVTSPWDSASERGVVWNDPDLAIVWPLCERQARLSEKDLALPRLRECPRWF